MFCIRVIVFILLIIFTAAATCSSLFALSRVKYDDGVRFSIYYWFSEHAFRDFNFDDIMRVYTRDEACDDIRIYDTVSSALGRYATLMSLAHIYIRPKCCMCFGIFLFSFLAFACFGVCVALTAMAYATESCKDDSANYTPALKDADMKIAEGFGLACAAAGGFLISMLLELCA